jgi:hypothetical protein
MPAAITLHPAQRDLLTQALDDAVDYRDPPLYCAACDAQPASDALCPSCADTFARATAYRDLSRALGLEEPSE